MEVVETLAEGDDGVRQVGPHEWFESFYDWVPHRRDREMWPNSAMTQDERAAILEVSVLLDAACDSTPGDMTVDDLISTGWPKRIQPIAESALMLMERRGRFSEDHEEETPASIKPGRL